MLRDNHHAAGLSIDPVHDAGPDESGQRRLLIKVKLDGVEQSLAGKVAAGMSDLSRRFVDCDQPGIFVDHLQRQWLGNGDSIGRTDQSDADKFAGTDSVFGFGWNIVHRHTAGFDHSLQSEGRVVSQMLAEKRVDSFSAEERFDDEFANQRAVDATAEGLAECWLLCHARLACRQGSGGLLATDRPAKVSLDERVEVFAVQNVGRIAELVSGSSIFDILIRMKNVMPDGFAAESDA